MTEHERKLTRLDVNKINADGRYVDFENNNMFRLSYDDILFLRAFYQDRTIAHSYEFANIQPLTNSRLQNNNKVKTRPAKPKVEPVRYSEPVRKAQPTKKPTRPKYELTREQKYTGKKHKGVKFNGKRLVAGILVIFMSGTIIHAMCKESTKPIDLTPQYGIEQTYDRNDVAGVTEPTLPLNDQIVVNGEKSEKEIIQHLADIYQIDGDKAYDIIAGLTNDFSSDSYTRDFTIKDVSCKGSGQLYCSSEEEILLYTMRVLKQDPGRFGIKYQDIKGNSGYETKATYDNYVDIIGHYSQLLDVDPCLIYGIMKAETGWCSDLLNGINNPAGLKNIDGTWWEFSTKEEGIIELILQVKAYQAKGAMSVEDMAEIHCPINDPDDVNKINQYWVGNVKDGMQEAQDIYKNMQLDGDINRL